MTSRRDESSRLLKGFLEELRKTLDLRETIKKLDITEEAARDLLDAAVSGLFGETVVLNLYVDGAARGNPGQAGIGAVIKDANGRTVKSVKKRIGVTTNNVAEYTALVTALEEALALGGRKVHVFADSELIVRQINGQYRVKNERLKPLYREARGLIERFDEFRITHIARERNAEADRLANEAIDGV